MQQSKPHGFLLDWRHHDELWGDSKSYEECEKIFLRLINDPTYIDVDTNTLKGDFLEFLALRMAQIMPNNPIFGLSNYKHISKSDDNGADGIGENIMKNQTIVQSKFKTDWSKPLNVNTDHLSNMFNVGDLKGIISNPNGNENDCRYVIFTNTVGLDHTTESFFNGDRPRVRVIDRNRISILLEDNISFFNEVIRLNQMELPKYEIEYDFS
jgi:hypothetical protein